MFVLAAKTWVISVVVLLSGLLFQLLMVRYLSLEDRGIYVAITAVSVISATIFRIGQNQVIQFKAGKYSSGDIFKNMAVIIVPTSIFAGVLSYIYCLHFILDETKDSWEVAVIAGVYSLLTTINSVLGTYIYTLFGLKKYAVMNAVQSLSLLLGCLYISQTTPTLTLFLDTAIFSLLIGSMAMLIYFREIWDGESKLRMSEVKSYFVEGAKSSGWSILKDVNYKLDQIIFPQLMSAKDFGAYSILILIGSVIWRITDPLCAAYSKILVSLSAEDGVKLTNKILWWVAFLPLIGVGLALLLSDFFLEYVLKKSLDTYGKAELIAIVFAASVYVGWKVIAYFNIRKGSHGIMYYSSILSISVTLIGTLLVDDVKSAIMVTSFALIVSSALALHRHVYNKIT